jgi:uncharacterized protein (DUF169 family)
MPINQELVNTLSSIGFVNAPVAIAFLATPPPGLDHIGHAEAAGCGYWKQASEGRAFYTTAEDHGNCPIGAFTHGVELSPEKGQELQSLIGTMIELKYLKKEEIQAIPHRAAPMRVAAYAPLAEATFEPDVIVFRGNVRQIMLMSEAARAAGVFETGAVMGRPACAMIPQAINTGASVASVGCIGNRVYTGLGDDELYLTVPGSQASDVLQQLETILTANRELEKFHRQRAATIV